MASSAMQTHNVRLRKLRKRGKANKSARNNKGTTLSPEQLFAVK
jgi:hypothetical protein